MAVSAIVLSLDAERDLDALFDYIARDSGLDQAEAALRRIDDTLMNLAAAPLIGRVRSDLDGFPRALSVWPWLVIYEPMPQRRGVFVWRIIDGRRDLPHQVAPPIRR